MSMAETFYILNHFYNIFDIPEKLETLEKKVPFVAGAHIEDEDMVPDGYTKEDLKKFPDGLIWFETAFDGGVGNQSLLKGSITRINVFKADTSTWDSFDFSANANNVFIVGQTLIQELERNGTVESAIQFLLDRDKKQDNVVIVNLPAAGWAGSTAPYTQTITLNGVKSTDEPLLVSALDTNATVEQQKAYTKAFGIVSSGTGSTSDGSITFKVYKMPATDVRIGLKGIRTML